MKKNLKNPIKRTSKILDIKLKPLSPSLRQKKRFVKFKIVSEKKFEFKELSENLIEQIILFLGIIDFGKGGIWILRDKFDYEKQEIILKVSTKLKDKLIGVLSLITKINNSNINIEVKNVSGTLKGLEK